MKVVIIGNGIAGITAARFIRKLSDHEIVVISKESDYFISRPALMYVYMGHIPIQALKPYEDNFWSKNRINLLRDEVTELVLSSKELKLAKSGNLSFDKLIIATGSIPALYGWPGQDLNGVGTFYSLQDLEYIESESDLVESAIIVGGGLIGIELAEMLHSRGKKVTLLVREKSYWDMVLPPEESKMVSDHIKNSGIELLLSTELKEIKGTDGRVTSVITSSGDEIPCEFVGIATGVKPNIDLVKNSDIQTDRGILVDNDLQTSVPNIFAIGDCVQLRNPKQDRKSIEAVWYTGRIMGETVAYTLCNQTKEYDPGIWYNSAKFVDLEYQVYGLAPAQTQSPLDSELWIDSEKNQSIRIYFDQITKEFKGIVSLGVRMRQEVASHWIEERKHLSDCLRDINEILFQPEFNKVDLFKNASYAK